MNNKVLVIENVFDDDVVTKIANFVKHDLTPMLLIDIGIHKIPEQISCIYDYAANHYQLDKSLVGNLECWKQQNRIPEPWHVDIDEMHEVRNKGEIRLPLMTIIYYPEIENLVGGEFRTENIILTPKTNTMVIMSPGMVHSVNPIESGTRLSFMINPWDTIQRTPSYHMYPTDT